MSLSKLVGFFHQHALGERWGTPWTCCRSIWSLFQYKHTTLVWDREQRWAVGRFWRSGHSQNCRSCDKSGPKWLFFFFSFFYNRRCTSVVKQWMCLFDSDKHSDEPHGPIQMGKSLKAESVNCFRVIHVCHMEVQAHTTRLPPPFDCADLLSLFGCVWVESHFGSFIITT